MLTLLRLSRVQPLAAALLFGVIFTGLRVACDWFFRSMIPDHPMPPTWSVLMTQSIGSAVAVVVLYWLLQAQRRQMNAVRDLNHELRNALQVFSYIIPQCAQHDADRGRDAVMRMTTTLQRVSRELGYDSSEFDWDAKVKAGRPAKE